MSYISHAILHLFHFTVLQFLRILQNKTGKAYRISGNIGGHVQILLPLPVTGIIHVHIHQVRNFFTGTDELEKNKDTFYAIFKENLANFVVEKIF